MVARVVLGRRSDGARGFWVTKPGFDARSANAPSSYLLSTSDGVGVGSILASGTFSLGPGQSVFQPFGIDFGFVPQCFIQVSAGSGGYSLAPQSLLASLLGTGSVAYLVASSNGVTISNPSGQIGITGAWFAIRR